MVATFMEPEGIASELSSGEKGEWAVDELEELRMEDEREKRADEGKQ